MIRSLITAVILVLGISLILCDFGQPQTVVASQTKDKNAEGRKLFQQYCASCHGQDAKGNGPVAPSLKTPPSDLTRIEKKDGKFPFEKVQQTINGEGMSPAHGNREMPVWGSYLRRSKGEGFAKLDLYNLTKYIESIQQD